MYVENITIHGERNILLQGYQESSQVTKLDLVTWKHIPEPKILEICLGKSQ